MIASGGLGEFLAGDLTALAGFFEFFVTGGVDLLVAAFEPVFGGDEADGGVQPRGVVVIAQLSESGLDINTSPAVQVWDVAHRGIIAWMGEHGIKTGLRPQERASSPDDRLIHGGVAPPNSKKDFTSACQFGHSVRGAIGG